MALRQHNLSSYLSDRSVFSWESWKKSTHASALHRPSVSYSSISLCTSDTMGLMNIIPIQSNLKYPLSSVIGSYAASVNGRHHNHSCRQLARWITTKAADLPSNESIRIGTSLPSPVCYDPLWITSCKLPDLAWWYDDDEVIEQIEVVSLYNRDKTLTKLCLGLVDQLCSWKNRLSTVSSVVGISNNRRTDKECGQCVQKVQLCRRLNSVRRMFGIAFTM